MKPQAFFIKRPTIGEEPTYTMHYHDLRPKPYLGLGRTEVQLQNSISMERQSNRASDSVASPQSYVSMSELEISFLSEVSPQFDVVPISRIWPASV